MAMCGSRRLSVILVVCLAMLVFGGGARADAGTLEPATVRAAVASIAVELREAYVFPAKGNEAADLLERGLVEGAYDGLTDPEALARRLTADLQGVTGDSHMRVISGSPFRQPAPSPGSEDAGFEVARLAGNVGYTALSRFVPPDVFGAAADEAMRRVADARALVIDIRGNGGGHPASVAYLASFFLDPGPPRPVDGIVWRNRGTATFRREEFLTKPTPVHYLGRPVYVLVGPRTYSAGEAFAYDLQALKRATVVGSRTHGGAHPGGLHEIGPDLFVVVPTGRAENPVTRGNWQGVGVTPDIQVDADRALDTALALAGGDPERTPPRHPL